ncbi:MAG: RNA polymerase sigma factor [Armatimonas sp.]
MATVDTEPSDEELVTRFCTQSDEGAFDTLVRRYRQPVFQLAVSLLGPGFVGEAEEVAQEVFLRVHHSLPKFRKEAKFSSWLYRVTFNYTLNVKARVRYRKPHISYQSLGELSSPGSDPSNAVPDMEREQAIAECMARLPEVYQSALRLYYWLDYSIPEISELLGMPQNTIKSYLHRARHNLRAMLEQKGYEDA